MKKLNERGQSIAEYAIVVGLVVAAIFSLGPYVKGRLGAPVKGGADSYIANLQTLNGQIPNLAVPNTYYADQDSFSTSDNISDMSTQQDGTVSSDSRSLTYSNY